jgi:hypothetical protein
MITISCFRIPLMVSVFIFGVGTQAKIPCPTDTARAKFRQNCEFAGIQYYGSFGGTEDKAKIDRVCSCIINNFVVENNPGLDPKNCETPVRWINGFLRTDAAKAVCGGF